ncbi:MAG: hypothetical protein COX96_01535 [Candidatus Omnitrophica bacterium CG_4_10_14_0_2_um_filter_44_9]|nr:MAG: hypothetical protein COY78_05265 [Candidatus Omnitrophica bacterium CG_4_10_14_0_8_um_filter_44_12]PIZ84842.1 MAG: hypothetical protein COX96_01535 [Candidatus Omnitrophica bacterium CG_4_10_14_0_2_um_filter_44_9]
MRFFSFEQNITKRKDRYQAYFRPDAQGQLRYFICGVKKTQQFQAYPVCNIAVCDLGFGKKDGSEIYQNRQYDD